MELFDILIVDDEQRYANMLARRLRLRGLTCEVCYDGKAALDMLAEISVTAMILDLRLPDLYGTDVLRKVKKRRPEITIIILTGHGTEKDRQECLALGAHSFMHKPLDIDRLMAIMTEVNTRSE